MAHGKSLILREIQPHDRKGAWAPNPWRRMSVEFARTARISRRRAVRILRRQNR